MRKTNYLLLFMLVIVLSACMINIPFDSYEDNQKIKVILKIEPDDAHVLLNGRYIGEAYEFSTPNSALRVKYRSNELIIKKEGYIEEVINLFDYPFNKITVTLTLRPDKDYVPGITKEKTSLPPSPVPKTVKEKEIPVEPQEETAAGRDAIRITLEIEPPEAAIYLDGKFWGISPAKGKIENLKLIPGKYSLEIIKPGYKPYKKELNLVDQKEVALAIKLVE